jgi:peptidyl-prolyl cis-trans isomerase SurA
MKDDYSKISNFALEEKKSQTMDTWIKNKLSTYYINVDAGTAADCPQLSKYATDKK